MDPHVEKGNTLPLPEIQKKILTYVFKLQAVSQVSVGQFYLPYAHHIDR